MFYKILADTVVLIHFLWIVFLILGAFWGTKNKSAKIVHISGLAFALIIQMFGWYCPLTHLEVWLRAMHETTLSYRGSFIIHYIEKIVYVELSGNIIFILSIVLCCINAWLYFRKKQR